MARTWTAKTRFRGIMGARGIGDGGWGISDLSFHSHTAHSLTHSESTHPQRADGAGQLAYPAQRTRSHDNTRSSYYIARWARDHEDQSALSPHRMSQESRFGRRRHSPRLGVQGPRAAVKKHRNQTSARQQDSLIAPCP